MIWEKLLIVTNLRTFLLSWNGNECKCNAYYFMTLIREIITHVFLCVNINANREGTGETVEKSNEE